MAQSFLLIDGYNLMHAAGMVRRRYGPGGLERARRRFLRFLANRLQPGERLRTTVVFDGTEGPSDAPHMADFDGIDVQFSESGHDADSVIEFLIAHHSAPRQLRVVSSDHRLQHAARRRRAQSVDSETFVDELELRPASDSDDQERSITQRPSDPKYSGELSPEQAEAWLAYFGECDDIPDTEPHEDEIAFWQERIDELPDDIDDGTEPHGKPA